MQSREIVFVFSAGQQYNEPMNKNKTLTAYLGMILYALFVGFSFSFVKTANGMGTATQVMTFRFSAAFLPHLLLLILGKEKISLRTLKNPALLFSALTYVGFLGFQAYGLLYTTSIVSGILFAMTPIFARLIAGVLLKEKTTWLQNAFMLLSVCSVIVLFVIGSTGALQGIDLRGLLLLLASTLCCSVSNVLTRYIKNDYSPLQINCYSCFVGAALFWIISLFANSIGGTWDSAFLPLSNGKFLVAILYLGICCTFITGSLISNSLRYLPAVNTTIWGNVSTAISVVAGALVLKEDLQIYQIVCTVLIITGVLGISFAGSKPAKK